MQRSMFDYLDSRNGGQTSRSTLERLLSDDLGFHDADSSYGSHSFHAFPAKFPPQLPRKFIVGLTRPGDVVLDPMMGSGTTMVEALLTGRRGIGCDIDPLASLITSVKTRTVNRRAAMEAATRVSDRARTALETTERSLETTLERLLDDESREFVDYWFARSTQLEIVALQREIQSLQDQRVRTFLLLALSSTIVTKSGGVSLAFDLAHTRPHRAKIVYSQDGDILIGAEKAQAPSRREQFLTKTLRSPLDEFEKRVQANLTGIASPIVHGGEPLVLYGDAQRLPLEGDSVDLVVTSPPYASNAIDYMRAHKFSLVWLGYPISELGHRRRECIGADATLGYPFQPLPPYSAKVVEEVASKDGKKGAVLHRYFSEMWQVLREILRVLKPGRAAILVVGSSQMRGIDTRTDGCLREIGLTLGFGDVLCGIRELDRNRRMMPAGATVDRESQIQQRMHQEFVLAFVKPS